MYRHERREQIVRLLDQRGSATVEQLAERFGVGVDSIRKDLQALAKAGRCERYYGGARRVGGPTSTEAGGADGGAGGAAEPGRDADGAGQPGGAAAHDLLGDALTQDAIHAMADAVTAREAQRGGWPWTHAAAAADEVASDDLVARAGRMAVARRALVEIHDGDTVFLDNSRTNALLAQLIATSGMHVIVTTNMPAVAQTLRGVPDVTVIKADSYLNVELGGPVGTSSVSLLAPLLFSKAFIGTSGVDVSNNAVTSNSIDTGEIKEHVIHNASYRFLLADASKFGAAGAFRFASITDFSAVITDTTDPAVLVALQRRGVPTLRSVPV